MSLQDIILKTKPVFVWCDLLFEGKGEDGLEGVYYVCFHWITSEWKQ